jgi:N-acetylmuramic acid 6-phosphate etherase
VQPVPSEAPVDVVIRPLTGPEVVTGSTRLKAGTATKLVLNMISTIAMVQLNKVYENLMVDLRATNTKLWDRGARIISILTKLDRDVSMELLKKADGHVKVAIVMHKRGVPADEARALLAKHDGNLRAAVG